mmetsp:Transcript_6493/g.26989  ORF Transcript_6493/g.26989 Transcript_6493/m.26989 type:complete len:435 (+) Transcript_6493:1781-3085(+)
MRLGILQDVRQRRHDNRPERGSARQQKVEQLRESSAGDEVRAVLGVGHEAPPRGVDDRGAQSYGNRAVRRRRRVDKGSKDRDAVRAAEDLAVSRPPVAQRREERRGRELHRILARRRVDPDAGRVDGFAELAGLTLVSRVAGLSHDHGAVHAGVQGGTHRSRDGARRVGALQAVQRGLHRASRAQTLRGGLVRVRHGHEKIERRRPLVIIRGGIRAGNGHGRLPRALRHELIDAERRQPGEEAKRLRLQVPQLPPRPPRPGALHARRRVRQRLHKGQQAGHERTPRERHPGLVVRELRQQLPREALHLEVPRGCRVGERVDHAVFESVQARRRRGTQLGVHGDVSRDVPQAGDPQRRAGASVLGEHARGDEQLVPELLVRFPVPLAKRPGDEMAESGAETLRSRPGRGLQPSPGGNSHALQHVPHQLGRVEHYG